MEKIRENKRYIYDPLYGITYLPSFVWNIIPCPELQRLREVRLCNINSFCLTGGANINRYEHAIGTCHLTQECLKSWPLLNPVSEEERKFFLLAALLHDTASAAFGHSVEYIESKEGFQHEKDFEYAVVGERGESYRYKSATFEPIFFGMGRELSSKIIKKDLEAIGKIIAGKGRFGPLINSTIDLDNIDNVFRLAYHIGLVKSGETPLKLARSLYIENGKLVARKEAVPLIEEWHKVRKKLYSLLLLNPEEFSAKCMLNEAIEAAKEKPHSFKWYAVDYELLEKLSNVSSESSMIVSRLMKGDLYGCVGIFSTIQTHKYEIFIDTRKRRELEDGLNRIIRSKFASSFKSAMVALHSIVDIDKTERQVCIQTDEGRVVRIGESSNQILIGVFFKNMNLNTYRINNLPNGIMQEMRQGICTYLSSIINDPDLRGIEVYSEIEENE